MIYIYAVFRPDGRVMYIGKGQGARWERYDLRAEANPHYAAILKQAGGVLPTVIIHSNLSEADAYSYEKILTEAIGIESEGGPLVNCGHGGKGGPSGVKRSIQWKKNRSLRAKEVWTRPEYRIKILRADRKRAGNNQPRTDKFKKKLSAGNYAAISTVLDIVIQMKLKLK